jgi:hypothetical protein
MSEDSGAVRGGTSRRLIGDEVASYVRELTGWQQLPEEAAGYLRELAATSGLRAA